MEKAIQIAYNDMFELKCRVASATGFGYIAINYTEVLDKNEYEWECLTEKIAKILDETKLKCVQSHPYYYDLRISSEIIDNRCEFAMHQAIKSSGKLGAKQSVYHPRSSFTTNFNTQASFEDNRVILSKLLNDAVNHGVSIAVENIPHFPDHPEWPFYTSDYRDLATLVDSFADPHISVCWDFGHANLMDFDQCEALRYLGKRITCTHIHNNFGVHDDHASPDTGTADWYGIMPTLAKIGYSGCLTLESECKYADPAVLQSFARHNYVCAEFLERLMKTQKT